MNFSVKRKLPLLLAGTLVVAFALAMLALGWLFARQQAEENLRTTRLLLQDIGTRITEDRLKLARSTAALAARGDVIATLALLTPPRSPQWGGPAQAPNPENNRLRVPDAEKRKLAIELGKYADTFSIDEIGIYDSEGHLVAFARKNPADHDGFAIGIGTWKECRLQLSGSTSANPDWSGIDRPAGMPATADEFGSPAAPQDSLRRQKDSLLLEAVAPLKLMNSGQARRVGWVRTAQRFLPAAPGAHARPWHSETLLLLSGSYDRSNPLGLRPGQLDGAWPLLDGPLPHAADPVLSSHHPQFFLDAAVLALEGGETAWFVALLDRSTAAQREALRKAVLAIGGALLLVLPFALWAGRRWIGKDFDQLAEQVRQSEVALGASEERWQFVLEGTGHGVWDLNPLTGEVFFSPAWRRMLGYSSAEVPDTLAAWRALIHPDDQPIVRLAFENHLRGDADTGQITYRMRAKTGEYRWVMSSVHLLRDAAGKPLRMLGTNTDITEQRLIQQRLEKSAATLNRSIEAERDLREAATVFEATAEAIMITDVDGVIKRINQAFVAMTGYGAAEALGQTPRLLQSERHDDIFYRNMREKLRESGRWEGETWIRRKSGETFPVWQIVSAVKDTEGQAVGFVSLFIDITQKKRDEDEIAYRANYDALTGLPNRNLLAERLSQALKQARRENSRVAVMFVDLDFFKQVNDTLGHAIGDRLLQLVAERMRLCVRETDTIARLGGDEFVILLMDIDGTVPASIVAEKIIALMIEAFSIEGNEIHIGASIGITIFPDDGHDVETLFRNADLAMYRAKNMGRSNAQFFEMALTTAALDRRALENDLRVALARNEFRLHFQPLVDLATNRITGVEALLRWQHPQRGLLEPESFVPLAEETGLIRDIGTWVLTESCRQLAGWEAAGHHLTLAINVSVRQLPAALSVPSILAVLAEHGLDPRQLALEITENVLLADAPAIQQWFVDAGAAGLHLTIDDFGTGYSSLSYLKRFPVRHVKIDKSFVRDMESDIANRSLVEAILAMAHSLGLSVVAEGVEALGQASLLRARSCEQAQGFLYSQPLPADEILALLNKPQG